MTKRQHQRPLLPRRRGRDRSGAASAAAQPGGRQEEQEQEVVVRFALIRSVRHPMIRESPPALFILSVGQNAF